MTAEQIVALVEQYGRAVTDQVATGDDTAPLRLAEIDAAVTALANERDELAAQLEAADVFTTVYRSVTPDGKTWCETSRPDEVVERSQGTDVRYEKLVDRLLHGQWEPWDPTERCPCCGATRPLNDEWGVCQPCAVAEGFVKEKTANGAQLEEQT